MHYRRKVVDLDTGNTCWTDLGDHRPLTEVAIALGIGPRKFREVLLAMGLVSRELDTAGSQFRNAETGDGFIPAGAKFRHRLTPWAVESGFGYRMDNVGFAFDPEKTPFDVLSPLGVEYVNDHLTAALAKLNEPTHAMRSAMEDLAAFEATRRGPLDNHGRVLWLDDHHPNLPASDVAGALGITDRLVRRWREARDKQLAGLRRWITSSNAAARAAIDQKTESDQRLAA